MTNKTLAKDYVVRCQKRLKAIDTLYQEQTWADVVRECQEVVELCLKALLRQASIEVPRIHDVGDILIDHSSEFPASLRKAIPRLAEISRQLRRDRELAFYGSEDLTPSEFYKQADADLARKNARWVVEEAAAIILSPIE